MMTDLQGFGERTVRTTGVAGTKLRDRAVKQSRDLNVRQLVSAERLSPTIDALYRSGRVEQVVSGLTGLDLRVGGMTVQVDWPDTETKRHRDLRRSAARPRRLARPHDGHQVHARRVPLRGERRAASVPTLSAAIRPTDRRE